jgi:hypothetical protein
MECPKCGGAMDNGLLVDWVWSGAKKGTWVKGDELPRIKMGLIPPTIEMTGECYVLEAHRCQQCGFLEWYANQRDVNNLTRTGAAPNMNSPS